MKTYTKSDIHEGRIEIAPGLFACITIERDDMMDAPWKEHEGHGPVSDWTSRDKRPGERVIHSDRGDKRFYDFRAAMQQAKVEGWGLADKDMGALAARLGRKPTKGEILAEAVERDFEFLRGWCADEWFFVVVTVSLEDEEGKELASDSVGGVESLNDYDREQAAEMLNTLLESHAKELIERAHWEARDSVTI